VRGETEDNYLILDLDEALLVLDRPLSKSSGAGSSP
jgi:hypothetical protein